MIRGSFLILFTALVFAGCTGDPVEPVYVGTASNMQITISELVSVFEAQYGIDAEVVSGSSGKLSALIEKGHPIDVFVSADMQYPMHLYRSDLAESKPRIYAFGELAIVARPGLEPSFEAMLTQEVHQIAIADPKIAPYGIASMTALENAGVLDSIESKLVYGLSISHATQFVDARAADIGITAKSLVVSSGDTKRNWRAVPDSLYAPLAQGVLLVKRPGNKSGEANKFFDFMTSDTARSILGNHGYTLPKGQ